MKVGYMNLRSMNRRRMSVSRHRLRLVTRRLGSAARHVLVLTLVFAIGPTLPLLAQAAAVAQSVASTPMSLHITILDGEDALNDIRERTAREPIVQVEDENHKPVAGALILFSIQNGGSSAAGGTFNGLSSLSVTTDANGRGIAHGFRPNQVAGKYEIAVTVSLGTLVATAVIHESNVVGAGAGAAPPPPPPVTPQPPTQPVSETTPPPSSNIGSKVSKLHHIPKKVWIAGGTVIVVGVVVGVVVATRGNSPTTITAGTGTVGSP
jgi:hypothetical protein